MTQKHVIRKKENHKSFHVQQVLRFKMIAPRLFHKYNEKSNIEKNNVKIT